MIYDLSLLKKLAGDDEKFIIDMVNTFRIVSPPIIEKMSELDVENKFELLGREAHKLIPGVSFLGADVLKNELVKIEEGVKGTLSEDVIHECVSKAREYTLELIRILEKDLNIH
jgi:hypothetical protein